MTTIDFYFNAEDSFQVACRLAAKALTQSKRLVIYAPQAETAKRIDRMLWSWPPTAFVPHCRTDEALALDTPVLIAAAGEPEGAELLLNLDDACPPHFERFERLLEIVSQDEQSRRDGRDRYRYYRERGYPISIHDLAAKSTRRA